MTKGRIRIDKKGFPIELHISEIWSKIMCHDYTCSGILLWDTSWETGIVVILFFRYSYINTNSCYNFLLYFWFANTFHFVVFPTYMLLNTRMFILWLYDVLCYLWIIFYYLIWLLHHYLNVLLFQLSICIDIVIVIIIIKVSYFKYDITCWFCNNTCVSSNNSLLLFPLSTCF